MKKIILGIIFLLVTPLISSASSFSLSPASPQVYDGTSEETITATAGANDVWIAFDVNGNNLYSCSMGQNTSGVAWATKMTSQGCSASKTFQDWATGAGTATIVNDDTTLGNLVVDCYV